MRIKQESERRYNSDTNFAMNCTEWELDRTQQEAFEQGALYEQSHQLEKSKKLVEALKEIDALMNRLNPAIGNGLITDKIDFLIQKALADFEGEKEGE